MADDPDYYSKNIKVANFDVIHHKCCGNKLKGSYKDYKTIKNEDFNNYPKKESKNFLLAVSRNKRDDLWIQRDLMLKYFKENFWLIFVVNDLIYVNSFWRDF